MTCATRSSDGLAFGIDACSTHGECVNSTCRCDEWWTGGGDMFDLRINPVHSLDCSVPVIGVIVIWGIIMLVIIIRQISSLLLLIKEFQRSTSIFDAFSRMPFRLALLDLLFTHPFLFTVAILKIFYGRVIGTDPDVTVLHMLGTTCGLTSIADFNVAEFKAVSVFGSEKLRKKQAFLSFMSPIVYMVMSIPTFISLSLDRSIGPIANFQYGLLILRSIGVLGYNLSIYISNEFIRRQIHLLFINEESSELKNTKAHQVIEYIQKEVKASKKRCVILFLVYLPFLLPFGWPFYGFIIAFAVIITGIDMPAIQLLKASKKKVVSQSSPITELSTAGNQPLT